MNIVLKNLTASAALLLAACGQNSPDPSGKYVKPSENDERFSYSYEISHFDEKNNEKYKFKTVSFDKKERKIDHSKEQVYVDTLEGNGRFCTEGWKEMGIADCFEYDPKKGIRLNGRTEFFKKVE